MHVYAQVQICVFMDIYAQVPILYLEAFSSAMRAHLASEGRLEAPGN